MNVFHEKMNQACGLWQTQQRQVQKVQRDLQDLQLLEARFSKEVSSSLFFEHVHQQLRHDYSSQKKEAERQGQICREWKTFVEQMDYLIHSLKKC